MSLCLLSYFGGVLDCASAISCGSDAVTCLVTGWIITCHRFNPCTPSPPYHSLVWLSLIHPGWLSHHVTQPRPVCQGLCLPSQCCLSSSTLIVCCVATSASCHTTASRLPGPPPLFICCLLLLPLTSLSPAVDFD
jgi:hypothetical protein